MWKQAYESVKKQRWSEVTSSPDTARAPSMEGGDFFEMFAEMLQNQAQERRRQSQREDEPSPRTPAAAEPQDEDEGRASLPLPEETDPAKADSADEASLLADALGSNIEALYVEVLHMILHTVGSNGCTDHDDTSLLKYLQLAFKFNDLKHQELMERARLKEAPNILLHVEVLEAKDLVPMDVNGLSDTFCALYLASDEQQQYNTSIKMSTLCPEWKEHFCLAVENSSDDCLCVEAWDFDPAETVREKLMKVGDVKGIKGWGKLVREFGSAGKNENEFIGSAVVPLKSISATGEIRWCDLEKKGRTGKRGSVKLKMVFSTQKNTETAFKDHRNLLRLLLLYELEDSQAQPYEWNGHFSTQAETVLTQHLVQSGLSPVADPLVKWMEYCNVHKEHPISYEMFTTLLRKLLPSLQNSLFAKEKEILFWEATKQLVPLCLNGIKRLHTLNLNDKNTHQMVALLRILSYLRCIKLPEGFELFSPSICGCSLPQENQHRCDIIAVTKFVIIQGTQDWYDDMLENNINYQNSSEKTRLTHIILIVKNAMKDLQRAIEIYDRLFQETLQLTYAAILFSAHGCKISELVEPVIEEIYQILKPLKFVEESSEVNEEEALSLGMQLFDLYQTLQRFVEKGFGLSSGEEKKKNKLSKYHLWFQQSVIQWLDITSWKAFKWIKKAVELDKLVPISDTVNHSSSAVDTLTIFNQIKIFWQQLAWPDVEGSYVFVAKIVDDICQCSVYYANNMSQKMEGLNNTGDISEHKFEVSKEWCLAINNIEYIWQAIEPFVSEFGVDDILNELDSIQNDSDVEQCRRTLQLVLDNSVEIVGNKISELLHIVAEKMIPAINKFLLEGTEFFDKGDSHIENLLQYLDKNLIVLHSELSSEMFQQMLLTIWQNVASILFRIVDDSLEEKKPRVYFNNLQRTLETLLDFFKGGDKQGKISESRALKEIGKMLELYGMETSQLINKFYFERMEDQKSMENAPLGILTICAEFDGDYLKIQVLSGRNLYPTDSNGSCDPYVEIDLVPTEKFIGIHRQRTKTHKKTLFPLFDESFSFVLNKHQRETKNAMVVFLVKDKDILGNDLVGEAFLTFSDIEKEGKSESGELQQLLLKLSLPKNLDSQVSKALQLRQGDKVAKEFIKKQRTKAAAH